MAKIVARDDCAGESTGIRYVQYRDMVKSLGWNYLNFLPTRSCKCSSTTLAELNFRFESAVDSADIGSVLSV